MNWGRSIVVGMAAFMAFIMASVFYMVRQDTDMLEEDDYYDQGMHYNQVYELKKNVQRDRAMPTLRLRGDSLYIHFSSSRNTGNVHWKRRSDASLDKVQVFQTMSDSIMLPSASQERGLWEIKLTWNGAGTAYQSIHHLFIP